MKTALFLVAAFATVSMLPLAAQVTPTSVFPSLPSQYNTATACLELSGQVQSPGFSPSALQFLMGIGSPSTTFAYQSAGSVPATGPGSITLSGAVQGNAFAPFILAISIQPGGTICGGFAGAPCMTGPRLYGSVPTAAGLYHLDANPFVILDGIGGLAPPAVMNAFGTFPLSGTLSVGTATSGGIERSLALQALVVDASAPTGLRLTGALTVEQWVFYL